ncbi:MAG: hypothetical protein BGP03_20385 [Pseudonocardia sp. 73-21]|nr:MAG: hypothetical protein BGP03_20385 [Pseudonocardia sp. 73-21]
MVARAATITALAIAVVASAGTPALAYTQIDRNEQTRYAVETMNLTYSGFLARKDDFTRAGCRKDGYENNGFPYPGCRKPSPYNAFNWSDDGCSGREQIGFVSNVYRNLFNKPCQLHDFGYRNFGKGLTLSRTEETRAWIDSRFRTEMYRLCETNYAGNRLQRGACKTNADIVWATVRNTGGNWDTPPETPPAPLDPTPAPQPVPAPSPTHPTFTVMNTSEAPPDGVWFRRSPHTADTDRVTGHGVYRGERVQLTCYAWGDAVGAYGNRLWYAVTNVTRPTVASAPNSGYLSAHYVDDGAAANQTVTGVPAC